MYRREWLIEKTRFYQNLGFFQAYTSLSDEELAERMIALRQDEEGETNPDRLFVEGYDWEIPRLDKERVLVAAADILYSEEPPEYSFPVLLETLEKLSFISRGVFMPRDIREIGTRTIAFRLGDRSISLVPEGPPDDPLILAGQINPTIAETGYQFKQWDLYPDVFVMVMTAEEVEQFGGKFLPDRWMFDRQSEP